VARTKGNADRLSMAEADDLLEMSEAAARRGDFHAANRIERFLQGNDHLPAGRDRTRTDLPDLMDDDEMTALFAAMMDQMPRDIADSLREMVIEVGRDEAVAQMVNLFRSSPGGQDMPEPILRELCQMLVEKAMNRSRSRYGRKTRRSQLFDA